MTVYLVLYLWHAIGHWDRPGQGVGGPQLLIQQMPDPATCEEVGKIAKEIGDRAAPPRSDWLRPIGPRPVEYRCVVTSRRKP